MKVLFSLACAGLTAAASPSLAADLLGTAPPLTMPASQAPTLFEAGSNWYLRGDLGVSFDEAPTISLSSISVPPPGLVATPYTTPAGTNWSTTNFTGGLGAGYRFNDYLRFDATWDYRTGAGGTRQMTLICPYAPTTGVHSQTTGLPAGNLYNTSDICNGRTNIKQYNNAFLANAYVDLGTYSGFTPYAGGGLGLNMNVLQGGFNADRRRSGLRAEPHASGRVSADLGQSAGPANLSATRHRLRSAILEPVDQLDHLHFRLGAVGRVRLPAQSERDPRHRLSLPQQRRDYPAHQPANGFDTPAKQRLAATARRHSLRIAIGRQRASRLTRRRVSASHPAQAPSKDAGRHVPDPDDVAAVRAAVLVPVLLGVQRQFRSQYAGHAHSLPLWRRESPSRDPARDHRFHTALDPAFGARRRARQFA